MTVDRRLALWAGILYLATFATSFPALALKTPLLAGEAEPGLAAVGTALEIALAFTCVGTAIALYPIARRVSSAAGPAALLCLVFREPRHAQGLSAIVAHARPDVSAIPCDARALGTGRADRIVDR